MELCSWNYAADLTRKYTFLSLFSINSYFETEPDIQSIIQQDVQDATHTTLEMLQSILNKKSGTQSPSSTK